MKMKGWFKCYIRNMIKINISDKRLYIDIDKSVIKEYRSQFICEMINGKVLELFKVSNGKEIIQDNFVWCK